MPLPTPESNQLNISHLLTALGLSVSIILTLVGVIYHSITKRADGQQEALNDGADMFTANAVALERVKSELQSMREWMIAAERAVKELELKVMQDHDKLTTMQADHKHNHP